MKPQEYIKYLLCTIVIHAVTCSSDSRFFNGNQIDSIGSERQSRGVLDLLLGRFRTCGGCQCGRPNRNGAKMLGGEFTDTHEFPWLANIHLNSGAMVSGVLINDRYVLTAASQLIGSTAPEVKVSLGEYDRCSLDISSVNMSVESIVVHPEFNKEAFAHDLALIRLSRPTPFEKRISPVCLPNPGSSYLGQVGTLSGWTGNFTTEEMMQNDKRTCRPRKLGLPILGRNECLRSGVPTTHYHEDSGCIGVVNGCPIICTNDVGSSVLYRSYSNIYDLVGILPEANNCEGGAGTAVYTRVGSHLDWLLQHTKDACYCTK